jgi:hypothetical protein
MLVLAASIVWLIFARHKANVSGAPATTDIDASRVPQC